MSNQIAPDACAAELTRLLDEQAEVCRRIRELSLQQEELVAGRKEDDLLRLLSEKQRLIGMHQAISAKAAPFRERWEEVRGQAGQAAHAKAEAALERLKAVLDEIVRLEDRSRTLLEEQQAKASLDIGKIQKGKMLNKAYGGGKRPPPAARFSDKKG